MPPLSPHPDRLLPADPATPRIARELYAVRRNHHGPTAGAYGADMGADIPMVVGSTHTLQRTVRFVGDTRAFLSIPARHDTDRRMDSGFHAELVADHRLTMDEALETAVDLVVTCPRKAFTL